MSESTIPARCELCVYARATRVNKTDIQTVLICKRFPPTAILQASAKGAALASMSPVVQPKDMCYEFQHDETKYLASLTGIRAPNESPGN